MIYQVLRSALILLTFSVGLQAQNTEELNRRALNWFEDGRSQFAYERYQTAAVAFERVLERYPDYLPARYMLGRSLFQGNLYERAEVAFRELIDHPNLDPDYYDAWFFLGKSQFHQEKFEKAEKSLSTFLEVDRDSYLRQEGEKWLRSAKFAKEAIKSPVPFEPKEIDLPLHDHQSVYLPMKSFDGNKLFFTLRERGREHLVFSDIVEDSIYQIYRELNFLQGFGHTAASALSPDGEIMLLTICHHPTGMGSCDLFIAYVRGGQWQGPHNIGSPVNTSSWESQPTFGPDGRTFYFASNRSGGIGGRDLWKSRILDDGSFEEPVNLGPEINTEGNEGSPFIHPDGQTMYFKSDGHPGMGDFDLFYSRRQEDGSWGKPQNLGYPINTPFHDGAIFVDSDGKTAFMASDRLQPPEKRGLYRIFTFDLHEEARAHPVTYLQAKVIDGKTGEPLEAEVNMVELKSGEEVFSGSVGRDGSLFRVLRAGGQYTFNAEVPGYRFTSFRFEPDSSATAADPFRLEIEMTEVELAVEEEEKEPAGIVLRNVLFEFASYDLTASSFPELDRLAAYLTENEKLQVEIHGHTDNVGGEEHNQLLSENRARAVVEYLIEKGVDDERISSRGFGENQPIASNETEEGRAQNRRTEMVILPVN